jgi:hypothetical protein
MARALVVIEAKGVHTPIPCNAKSDWRFIADEIRRQLAEQMEAERCGSVVVSVHFADERCDHEVG